MAEYKAQLSWKLRGDFLNGQYSREHSWKFDGGVSVPASSSPSVVRPPFSNPANVDPEEALVASIASCHMLSFLYVAMKAGVSVLSYEDEAIGKMTKNEQGAYWISKVTLYPRIVYAGEVPSLEQERELHHRAHHECYIANSVKTEITTKLERE